VEEAALKLEDPELATGKAASDPRACMWHCADAVALWFPPPESAEQRGSAAPLWLRGRALAGEAFPRVHHVAQAQAQGKAAALAVAAYVVKGLKWELFVELELLLGRC
jgi:hypothetical protein